MWFSPPELVTIIVDGSTLVCCWIIKNQNNVPVLKFFKRIDYTKNEIGDNRIFNHLKVGNDISSFLTQHSIKNPCVAFGFKPQIHQEKIIFSPAKKLYPEEFEFAFNSSPAHPELAEGHHQHQTKYIGKTNDDQHLHYGCSLAHAQLMQYKLFTQLAQLNLTHMTTSTAALLHALSKAGLPAAENAQENLSSYIKRCVNSYTLGEQLGDCDILNSQIEDNKELVVSCLGLFLLGRLTDGET